ncbi:MAG: ParA family protein [Bacteroidetes bacterium]|nr:MAG: ParA family protein [Bacteroidota bacterium]
MIMRKEDILARIRENLEKAGLDPNAKVLAQLDPYSNGWHIAVISSVFSGKSHDERKKLALRGLEEVSLAWLDLITPEEKEWAGPLPGELAPEDLPLWPESMARGSSAGENVSNLCLWRISDVESDLKKPVVATFYSLRGGVGRSTALVCTARLLARSGLKVVCVDMDLEAPALPALFDVEKEVTEGRGVVDLLLALDEGGKPDFADHLLQVDDNLFVLPAGLVSAGYALKMRYVQPVAWYNEDRNPLRQLMQGLRERLPFRPDVLLLDARTGITDLSGPLLFDLADVAIVVFFPHPQARRGTELLVRSLLASPVVRTFEGGKQEKVGADIRFVVSPLPAAKIPEVEKRYQKRPLEWIEEWFAEINELRQKKEKLAEIEAAEITHFVPYREEIATSDAIGRSFDSYRLFEPVTEWIQGVVTKEGEEFLTASVSSLKPRVLEELGFASGQAENQQHLLEDFVKTDKISQALSPEIVLIRGRKGTGKTALFRYLSEREEVNSLIIHAPTGLQEDKSWVYTADDFLETERIIKKYRDVQWRHFWAAYVLLAIYWQKNELFTPPLKAKIAPFFDGSSFTKAGLFKLLSALGKESESPASLNRLLKELDDMVRSGQNREKGHPILLLFDGLDTGFGSSETERTRRRTSLEGLFDFWMQTGQQLGGFAFKILLREDIWQQLNFQNKSHLYGRNIALQWKDQVEFLKVPLKQALRSEAFKEHEAVKRLGDLDFEYWGEKEVHSVWNILVGERMKGSSTTFTRNWVWNRLADANGDHSPRYLVQLLNEAVEWEREEHERRAYDKSFIRPRALIQSLPKVSEEAFHALEEEFGELGELFDCLKQIGRTPLSAKDLKEIDGQWVSLAREVGLLSVYEEEEGEVRRFKVPDLYRYGLKMTRKGQA